MSINIDQYYQAVQNNAGILTEAQTRRWSTAVLKTLGLNLNKRAKRTLASALPDELAGDLTRVFWLAHFRNVNLPAQEFQSMVARRSGQSDPQFARRAITAVFSGLKQIIDKDTSDKVIDSLSPELADLWTNA